MYIAVVGNLYIFIHCAGYGERIFQSPRVVAL